MALLKNNDMSFEEYLKLKEEHEGVIEFIDGIVYMAPSPSTQHQRISAKLASSSQRLEQGPTGEGMVSNLK